MADESQRGVELERQAGIDTGYDYHFERNWGRFERGVWVLLLLILAAGLAGLFGRGPLNKVKAQLPDGTSIQYERVVRFKSPSVVSLSIPFVNGVSRVEVDRKSAEKLGIQQIMPQPTQDFGSEQLGPFEFRAPGPDVQKAFVQLSLQPSGIGPVTSSYRINNTTSVQLKQFILP
jgi:hypothetical protein